MKQGYQLSSGKMSAHRSFVLLAVFTGFLAMCCVALVGLLIWREYYTETEKEKTPMTNITIIRQTFPGYFRTPEEQAAFEKENNFVPVVLPVANASTVHRRCFYNGYCERNNTFPTYPTYPTSFSTTTSPLPSTTGPNGNPNQNLPSARRRRQVSTVVFCTLDRLPARQLTYHGCCVSYTEYIEPKFLPTAEPNETGLVQIAQFPFLKQYFSVQECCQAQGCTGCQCAQTYYVVSAVVRDGDDLEVQYVRVPGCCQCLNSLVNNNLN